MAKISRLDGRAWPCIGPGAPRLFRGVLAGCANELNYAWVHDVKGVPPAWVGGRIRFSTRRSSRRSMHK